MSKLKNHFIFSYFGNKRGECPQWIDFIESKINIDEITTVVEPFCGSSAFSYFMWQKYPDKKFKFVLNDNDKYLIELYETCRDETLLNNLITNLKLKNDSINNKDDYDNLKKDGDPLVNYVYYRSVYAIREGLYPIKGNKSKNFNDILSRGIVKFIRSNDIIFTNGCALECFNLYKDDPQSLIFFDPPYLEACNDFYANHTVNIYEFFSINNIDQYPSKIIFCLENSWIIKLLFKKFINFQYSKKYETSKRTTTHILLLNQLII